MPFNRTVAEQRLQTCAERLKNLFTDLKVPNTSPPDYHIDAIITYYNESYEAARADDHKTIKYILDTFEHFVNDLEAVKAGTLSIGDMSDRINETTDERKFNIFKYNVAKSFAAFFWLNVAVTMYAALFLVALPVVLVQIPIGIAMSVALGGFLFSAINSFIDCTQEFKSFKRHDNEHQNKHRLLSFFNHKSLTTSANDAEAVHFNGNTELTATGISGHGATN